MAVGCRRGQYVPSSLVRGYNEHANTISENQKVPFLKLQEAMNKADYTPGPFGIFVNEKAADFKDQGLFEEWGLSERITAHPDTVSKVVKGDAPIYYKNGTPRPVPFLISKTFIKEMSVEELFGTPEEVDVILQERRRDVSNMKSLCEEPCL